jgi:hypothetical protein
MTPEATIYQPFPVITAQALAAMNELAKLYDQQGMRLSCRCCGKGAIACHFDKPMAHQPTCLQREDLYPWQRFFSATDMLRHSLPSAPTALDRCSTPIPRIDGDINDHPQAS